MTIKLGQIYEYKCGCQWQVMEKSGIESWKFVCINSGPCATAQIGDVWHCEETLDKRWKLVQDVKTKCLQCQS